MPEKTRSCLIYMPPLPMEYGDLRPKRTLGAMLRILGNAGHESQVLDYASLDTLTLLAPARNKTLPVIENPLLLPEFRRETEQKLISLALQQILGLGHLDFILCLVEKRSAFSLTLQLAKVLRQMRPGISLLLAGSYAERYGETLLNAAKCFDAALLDNPEEGVLTWADTLHNERCTAHLPNIALLGGKHAPRHARRNNNAVIPLYDKTLYPAVKGGQFLHFDVPMSHMPVPIAREACGLNTSQLWTNTPENLQSEVETIARDIQSRAIHFTGPFTPASDSRDMLSSFLRPHTRLCFSRDAHVHHVDSFSVNEWARAGAHSVHFKVPSGSQRLLEDFYGECFGVSQVETVIRGCRDAGLFTVMHMQYPCPWDDYHTREETVRLLRRSRPGAVVFSAPEPVPGSIWYHNAKRYGFKLDYKRFGQWVAAENRTLPQDISYRMAGWTARKLENERSLLLNACAELGVPVGITAQSALAAHLVGGSAKPEAFLTRLTHATATLDTDTLAELMHDFNTKARIPKISQLPAAFTAYRIAVGN